MYAESKFPTMPPHARNAGPCRQRRAGEKGRQIKEKANMITAVVLCLLALPILTCCLGGMFSGNRSTPLPEKRGPSGWNKDQLERDVNEVVRDPNKTILIPNDGSQPKVVPNPYPSSSDLDPP